MIESWVTEQYLYRIYSTGGCTALRYYLQIWFEGVKKIAKALNRIIIIWTEIEIWDLPNVNQGPNHYLQLSVFLLKKEHNKECL
jgi:hypothetical protein